MLRQDLAAPSVMVLKVRVPADPPTGRRGQEWLIRVEPCRLAAEGRMAGVVMQTDVQGGWGVSMR